MGTLFLALDRSFLMSPQRNETNSALIDGMSKDFAHFVDILRSQANNIER
jgi:hypothetical protein